MLERIETPFSNLYSQILFHVDHMSGIIEKIGRMGTTCAEYAAFGMLMTSFGFNEIVSATEFIKTFSTSEISLEEEVNRLIQYATTVPEEEEEMIKGKTEKVLIYKHK